MEGTSVSDKDIDVANSRGGRYERQVLIGNPIRAYEVTGFTGQMVSFNAKEGGTVTGILMPASWKPENMARDPRLDLVNERAVGAWVKEYGIAVSSGEAYITRRMHGRSGYEIVVPSSRSKGAILFLDNVLRDTTGDFVKKGSKMIAVVGNISDVVLAARRIREITQKPFRPTSKPPDGAVQAINEQAKSEGDTRFSVAEPAARGAAMSETEAFDTLTEISDAVDVGLVQTVATEADLPPAVKAEAQRMGYTGRVEAVAHDGKVWIVRDRMRSKDHMKAKVVHELVHLGVREALTKPALDTVLNQTLTSFGRKMEMAAIARRRNLDLSKTGDYKIALEELIAKISEGRKAKPKVWQRFVAAIRQYLREKGYALALTDDDLDVLIGRALGRMAGKTENGGRQMRNATPAQAIKKLEDDIRFSLSGESAQSDVGFYSQVERTIAGFKQMKATGDQWARWLEKQPGVKKEELDWLGVKEWLAERPGAVTKADMLDFVRANEVDVREVAKGKWVGEGDVVAWGDDTDRATKFDSYQTPGGENYREVLLTLPPKDISERKRIVVRLNEISKAKRENHATEEMLIEEKRLKKRQIEIQNEIADEVGRFKSPHFTEPNILAHVRLNERTDADGKRVLFVEEVQSDWHQKGREKGYGRKEYYSEYTNADGYKATEGPYSTRAEAESAATATDGQVMEQTARDSVPDAPFKTSWPMLAMKRVIRMAAEEGVDRVAWTTGDMQAERYDLSKQVDAVGYTKRDDGTYQIKVIMPENKSEWTTLEGASAVSGDKLADYVGKELASKITEDKGEVIPHSRMKMFGGVDLKVGGEGMKGFYDMILPAEINKYVKKWGARVGEGTLNRKKRENVAGRGRVISPEEAVQETTSGGRNQWNVHALDITPAMRESVMAGQPMFALANDPSIEALQEHVNAGRLSPRVLQAARNVLGRARREDVDVDFEYQDIVKTENLFNPAVRSQLLSEGYTDEQLKAEDAAGQVFFIRGTYHPRMRRNYAAGRRSGDRKNDLPELHTSGMGLDGNESSDQIGWTIDLYKGATPNTVYHEFTHIMDKARGRVATEQRAKDYAGRIERGEDVQFSLADEYAEILEMLERAKPLPSRAATAGYKFGEAAGKANLQERMAKLRERAKERQLKAVMGARIGERAKGRRQGFKEGFQVGAKHGEESGKILATFDTVKLGFQEIARESKSQYFKVLLSAGETMEMARANEAGKTPEEIEKLQDWVLGKMFGEERYRNIRRSAHRDRGTAIDIVRQVLQKELAGKYGDEVGRLIGKAPKLMEQYQSEWDSLTENVTPEDLKRKNWSFAKNLYEQLSEIYQANQNERRMFMMQRRATAQEMASDAAGVIEQSYPVIKGSEMATPRRRGRGKYLFADKAGNAETRALGMSAGDPDGIAAQVLHRNIVDSETDAMTYEQDVARPVLEFMKQNGMDDSTLVKMISEYRPTQLGGRSVMMSDMEKIDLAASWQDPETKMLIAMNGFNMERRKGQQDARIMGNSPGETQQMVESIISAMPASHQRLATLMVDQATSMSDEMNKVSEVLDGWSRFTKPRYWMRRVDRSTTQQSIDVDSTARGVYQQTLKSLGFKKARQEHTHPAMIGDALAKFLNHVQMASRYAKMSLAEHDAINLIGNPDFAGAVNSRLGSGYLRDTREMIARAAGMKGFESDTPAGRFADYLSRNVAVSILWMRPTSVVYNRYGGSMLAYTELLGEDSKAAAWYLKNAFMPRFVKKAEKDAIIAKLLKNGYLGKRWRSDLAQTYSALPAERAGDMAKTSFRLKWRKMQDYGLQPMARAEMRNAIFAYMAKKHAGATDAEAVKTAERITRETQNPSSDVEAPGLYVELKNNHMGWIAPFLGQPAVSRNIVVRDSLLLRHALTTGNQTKIHAARVKLAASILGLAGNIALRVLVLSMMGKLYGYNDDDEKKDESWLRVVEIAVSDVLDLVLPGAGRLADGIFSVIQRKRPRDMSLFGGVQRGLVRGLTRVLHPFDAEGAFDAGKLWDGIYNLTEATLSAAGGPVGGPVVVGRIIKAQLFKEEEPMPAPSGARSRDSTRDRMDRLYRRREGR